MSDTEKELEYLRGQIKGLALQVATAFARASANERKITQLQKHSDEIIIGKMVKRSVEWRNGFSDSIGFVDSLLDV